MVLVVGLGGAALPQYFLSLTRKRRMTVEIVERDEGVIAVARKFFGVRESPKLRIHRDDAATFVPEAAVAGVLYDMIFFDVDDLTPDKVCWGLGLCVCVVCSPSHPPFVGLGARRDRRASWHRR